MAFVPAPPSWAGRPGPWGRLDKLRAAIDRTVCTLIAHAEADPGLGERPDVVAFLVRSGRDDGAGMSRAGPLRRTPDPHLCGSRNHGVGTGLDVRAAATPPGRAGRTGQRGRRGGQRIPSGHNCRVAAGAHRHRCGRPPGQGVERRPGRLADSAGSHGPGEDRGSARESGSLPAPRTVRSASLSAAPRRWRRPGSRSVAGARRCIGADFAIAEMDVVLRTVLQNFRLRPMPPPMRNRISGESPTLRNTAAASQ